MCNCCNLSREHSLWTVCFHIPDLQTVCGRSRIVQLWIHLFRLTGAGGAKEKRPVVRSNHRPFVTCRPHTLGGKATKLTEALSWCLVKSLSVKAGEAGRTRLWMCRHSSASQKLPALPLTPVWSRQQAGWPCAGQTSGDEKKHLTRCQRGLQRQQSSGCTRGPTLLREVLAAAPATTSMLFTNIYSGSFAILRSFIFNKFNILNPS